MRRAAAVCLALGLAGCGSTVGGGSKSNSDAGVALNAPVGKVDSSALPGSPAAGGDTIGTGKVKVALILPLTSPAGQPSLVGQSLRNAADLAYNESGSTDIQIMIKDDHSSPDGARAAAQTALSEGAEIVIGPLFAPDVREVSKVVRSAGKPMIAFSTDTSTASRGSYLLSFLIESYVDRVVDFAASKGKKSIAALIPDNDYGRVADAEFQQETSRRGMRVLEIEHYTNETREAAVKKVAALGDGEQLGFAEGKLAGEQLVGLEADAVVGDADVVVERDDKVEFVDEVRGVAEHVAAFAEGIEDEGEVELLEVADSAVDELGAAAGCALGEV